MTRPEQKEKERRAVECLRSLYPDFPAEPAESHDLGIEVTDYVRGDRARGSQENAFAALASKIAAAATTEYAASDGIRVLAWISFARTLRCATAEITSFAAAIASEVRKVAEGLGDRAETIRAYDSALPIGVESVVVYKAKQGAQTTFSVMQTGWGEDLLPAHVDSVIESKESKLNEYRKKCSEIWLLISVDGFRVSGLVDTTPELTNVEYETGFDRVLLLFDCARVIQLKPRAQP